MISPGCEGKAVQGLQVLLPPGCEEKTVQGLQVLFPPGCEEKTVQGLQVLFTHHTDNIFIFYAPKHPQIEDLIWERLYVLGTLLCFFPLIFGRVQYSVSLVSFPTPQYFRSFGVQTNHWQSESGTGILSYMDSQLFALLHGVSSLTPLNALRFPSRPSAVQINNFLVNNVLLNQHFQQFPPSNQYQKRFWKWAITHLDIASRKCNTEEACLIFLKGIPCTSA